MLGIGNPEGDLLTPILSINSPPLPPIRVFLFHPRPSVANFRPQRRSLWCSSPQNRSPTPLIHELLPNLGGTSSKKTLRLRRRNRRHALFPNLRRPRPAPHQPRHRPVPEPGASPTSSPTPSPKSPNLPPAIKPRGRPPPPPWPWSRSPACSKNNSATPRSIPTRRSNHLPDLSSSENRTRPETSSNSHTSSRDQLAKPSPASPRKNSRRTPGTRHLKRSTSNPPAASTSPNSPASNLKGFTHATSTSFFPPPSPSALPAKWASPVPYENSLSNPHAVARAHKLLDPENRPLRPPNRPPKSTPDNISQTTVFQAPNDPLGVPPSGGTPPVTQTAQNRAT